MDITNVVARICEIKHELLARKKNNALFKYNAGKKNHIKQILFHQNKKKNRWVFGGNRSGKTECGAVESIWIARGCHPYRENKKNTFGWVVSLSTQVQRDVAQNKILHYLDKSWIEDIVMLQGRKDAPDMGVIDTIIIKNVYGGTSKIGFKSCDQGREKFQGASLDFVWFDEEPPYDIYQECLLRILDKGGSIFGTMTPLKGLTWVYHEIYLNNLHNPEVWYEQMEWSDNPYLDKKEIDILENSLSKEDLDARKYGNFTASNGLVYPEFNENVHVIEPFCVPYDWYDTLSIDPGLNNPLSCHWYAVDFDQNIYVIAEHYEAKRDIEYHSNAIHTMCNRLNWPTKNGKISALIDSAANQRTLAATKSVSELFYDYGIQVNTNVNKDLFSGIQRVKSYLKNAKGETKLYIFKTCVHLIQELKGYFWGDADVPIKKDDHALDELRYYIMSKPQQKPLEMEKSIVLKNKERLIRKLKNDRYRLM